MTDPAIVLRKLAALRDHTARLRRRRPGRAEELRADVDLQDALAMSLVVAVQSALDVAMHIASDDGLGVPATYAEAFTVLARHGIVGEPTSDSLSRMAALRNRIAHGYATVDFKRIWAELPVGLQAFDEFAQAIGQHLGKKGGGSPSQQ
jgi:uncharacterized protein YutE (UPF0331/DUF86 family)